MKKAIIFIMVVALILFLTPAIIYATSPSGEPDGDWYEPWGTNRWQVMDVGGILGWYQNKPAGKGLNAPEYFYPIGYTYGYNGHEILEMLTEKLGENTMNGHYKFGLSSSVLEEFVIDYSDGVLDGRYLLGTYIVPVNNGTGINTDFSPVAGMNYYLEASGTYRFANMLGGYGIADAEWAYRNDSYKDNPLAPHGWTVGELTYPSIKGLDVLVDGSNIYWGDYNPSHIYNYTYLGTGLPINFSIYDSAYGDNINIGLTVKVYADIP